MRADSKLLSLSGWPPGQSFERLSRTGRRGEACPARSGPTRAGRSESGIRAVTACLAQHTRVLSDLCKSVRWLTLRCQCGAVRCRSSLRSLLDRSQRAHLWQGQGRWQARLPGAA
eukprot:351970-Chlamydomonas_euryale.AAC.8